MNRDGLRNEIVNYVGERRLPHVLGTERECLALASLFGLSDEETEKLAAAALLFLRRLFLGSMTFFGVIPFLPPVILAVMASFELPRSSVIAGIVFGALCDLVLPAPFACLYTIAFTLAALLISTVVSNLLQQGFARALLSTVLTFLLVDLLQAFALLPRSGSTAILPMLHLFARETALSCLLLLPVYPALRAIRRIFPD